MKNRKIYISGPISGTADYLERFNDAEKRLTAGGYEVVNPARCNDCLPKSTTYDQYMEMSICMLKMCGRIYMLKDWENSPGAVAERNLAKALGMAAIYEVDSPVNTPKDWLGGADIV